MGGGARVPSLLPQVRESDEDKFVRDFVDKTVVITGAANGIGRALATQLAASGANLALADIDEETLLELEQSLARASGTLTTHRVDVSSTDQLQRLHDHTLEAHGSIDMLVNNAGFTAYGALHEFSEEQVDRIVDVNLRSVLHGCRIFLPTLLEQEEAHILNMSSMASISGMPKQSTYCATKAAVRALSESLAAELARTNVNVSWMVAGPIGTGIITKADSTDQATTARLGRLLEERAMPPSRAAEKILHAMKGGRDEIRLTLSCEAYHQLNRLSPRFIRWSMASVQRYLDPARATDSEQA
jgi:short-subunit dehydrogenase